ncbi:MULTISPECIES: hypothetical protein [Frankia]|nr:MULTISPECIES: hypothetical protein [Frankia]
MSGAQARPSSDDHSVPGQMPPPPAPADTRTAEAPTGEALAGEALAGDARAVPDTRPALWAPAVRHRYLRPTDSDAWPVGFSPTGEALPETLTDVLLRGSHAIRSSKRAEAQRLERAAAVANHVDAQIHDFLDFCAAENLVPPVTVRARGTVARRTAGRHGSRPRAVVDPQGSIPARVAPEAAAEPAAGPAHRVHRRERLKAWPLLYWRCESFPAAGRSLHLFVEPGGRAFEGRDDPSPLTVLGREVRVWPVDTAVIVAGMAEVDARRCALHLVHGMAHLLWRAGVGL